MVGKANQQTTLHGSAIHRLFADIQTFFRRDAQKLLEQRPDLTRGLGVNTQPAAAVHLVAALLGVAPSAHQHKKIRLRLAVEQLVARHRRRVFLAGARANPVLESARRSKRPAARSHILERPSNMRA